ncbi:MAG: hypothetical protein Q7J31_06145, partial [Syntrophales bacterium]|nr:hypothetical protein [Syntrophales bacterium]
FHFDMSITISVFCGTTFLRICRFLKERSKYYKGLQRNTPMLLSKKSLKLQQYQRKLSSPKKRFWPRNFLENVLAFVVAFFLGAAGVFAAVWLSLFLGSRL